MKQLILAFCLSIINILSGCTKESSKVFLVGKEYIPGYVDNDHVAVVRESYMHISADTTRKWIYRYVPSEWYFYISDSGEVRQFRVDSLTYTKHKVGEKIIMEIK